MSDCDCFSNITTTSDSSNENCNISLSIPQVRTTRRTTSHIRINECIHTQNKTISSDCEEVNAFEIDTSFSSDAISGDEEIILAVYWKRGNLGAAFYDTSDGEVHILNDVVDIHPNFQNLRSLLNQVECTHGQHMDPNECLNIRHLIELVYMYSKKINLSDIVALKFAAPYSHLITSNSLAECFIETLSELTGIERGIIRGEKAHSPSVQQPSRDKIHFIPGITKNFNYDSCKRLILRHRLFFEPKHSTEEEHLLFMDTYIDFKKKSMVMSLGLLFNFLEKYIPSRNLSGAPLRIALIQNINLENVVAMDEVTYEALEIFRTVYHPSAFKRSDKSSKREGLSVFAIFNRCKSRIGVKKMRHIFKNPIRDVGELNTRLDAIEFCCKPVHGHIVKKLRECIKKVESVTGLLTNIHRTRENINHWKCLYTSLYNIILIGQICGVHSSHSKIFIRIVNSITNRVHEAAHFISRVVDFEESFRTNYFTVRVGINRKLDKVRQAYAQVPGVLLNAAKLELRDLPEFIERCSIVYITELGYLLSVPVWEGDGNNANNYQLPNFEIKFIVNEYVHYKTPRCAELDNILGDVLASKSRLESKVMVKLMEFVHTRIPDIVQAVNSIAELDCVIAMAEVACENNYTRPVFTTERKMEITGGRHPLQELCINNFVPNDAKFAGKTGAIKILTGPNASGKTVYLNQISLIAFLAHIGSFVPAEKALLCVLDHIHTRAHTLDSVSTRMSSFILDLKQMSHALYNSTPSSLIIMDEFGKGTTEIDGLSLLLAVLIHFVERKEDCPFVLVSTHFHTLLKLLPSSDLISFQYMDYKIEGEDIVYLHRIRNGTCNSSLLHLAAKSAGLRENSLRRFMQIQSNENIPLMCNTNLNVTKSMLKAVRSMERSLDSNEVESTVE